MKKKLTFKETVLITSMLFGMFFGAGNLIFPAKLGPDAGSNLIFAYLGMFITAVGLPLLATVALGMSRSDGILTMTGKIGKKYSLFFSTLLYLTIGPLFAIPRCASTSFSVGAVNLIPENDSKLPLVIFSFVFFAIVLFFSLRPSGIMTWIGKILNPIFLAVLTLLVVAVLIHPLASVSTAIPTEAYSTPAKAFFNGFLEGYNTLDALAGLAFGIVVVNVVRKHGITKGDYVAASTAKSGVFSCLFMGFIYFFITLISAQSSPILSGCADGGEVLGRIAEHYFKTVGAVLMAAIVTFACLKTAIGLVTSCSEAFLKIFPKGPSYSVWAIVFCLVSFGIANFGLSSIVAYCVPVLMFIYPLAITIILLALFSNFYHREHMVYVMTTAFTLVAAVFDFIKALTPMLPQGSVTAVLDRITALAESCLPFFNIGLGWVCPAVLGFIIGLLMDKLKKKSAE